MSPVCKPVREAVLERDAYRCRKCGSEPGDDRKLHVHHLKYETCNLDDLILLCTTCHTNFHQGKRTPRKFHFKSEGTLKSKRTPWAKEGKFRYLNRKLNALIDETQETRKILTTKLRVLTRTLAPFMEFKSDYIIQIVCKDERDRALFDFLISKGDLGITPTGASESADLHQFRLKPFQVTRRIQRMNKRLQAELGRNVAESHNRRWFVTNFVLSAWPSEKDVKTEAEDSS